MLYHLWPGKRRRIYKLEWTNNGLSLEDTERLGTNTCRERTKNGVKMTENDEERKRIKTLRTRHAKDEERKEKMTENDEAI